MLHLERDARHGLCSDGWVWASNLYMYFTPAVPVTHLQKLLFPSPLPAMCTLCKYLARPPGDRPTPFQLMAVNEYMSSPARNVMVQSPPESRGTPMAMLASLARVNIAVGKPQVDLRGSDVTSSRRITI